MNWIGRPGEFRSQCPLPLAISIGLLQRRQPAIPPALTKRSFKSRRIATRDYARATPSCRGKRFRHRYPLVLTYPRASIRSSVGALDTLGFRRQAVGVVNSEYVVVVSPFGVTHRPSSIHRPVRTIPLRRELGEAVPCGARKGEISTFSTAKITVRLFFQS